MTEESITLADAWRIEALRRAAEIDQGLVDTVSAEEVHRAALGLLKGKNAEVRELEATIAANVAEILEA